MSVDKAGLQETANESLLAACSHASIRMMLLYDDATSEGTNTLNIHTGKNIVSLCGNIFEFPKPFVIQISIESLTPINYFVPHHPSSDPSPSRFTILLTAV